MNDLNLNDPNDPQARRYRLRKALAELLNKHSAENGSDTPDFILADHLMSCLDAWESSIIDRERWYGRGKHGLPQDVSPHSRPTEPKP